MKHFLKFFLIFTVLFSVENFGIDAVCCQDDCGYTFDVEFRGAALKPSANNLYYAVEAFPFNNAIATPILGPRWQVYDLHPTYHFGFDLGLRGTCQERKSSIGINWQHFKSSTGASHTTASENMIGPFSSIGPDANPYKKATGCVQFKFDEVSIHLGQNLDCCTSEYLQTNFFAGVSVVRIKQCLNSTYSNPDSTIVRSITNPSSFKGAGPQCGLDFDYDLYCGLKLTGHIASGLFVGHAKNHTEYLSTAPMLEETGNPNPNKQSTSVEKRLQVIPSLEERVGFAYSFPAFCDCYSLSIEVGYEAKVFFNAIQSTDLSSGVVGVTPEDSILGVFARTYRRTLGNFALSGFYVGLGVEF